MWVEEITLENIKCFERQTIKLGSKTNGAYPWVTLLGENGTGKSTFLQAIALLLAGPEGAKQLLTRPDGWLNDESKQGKITIRLHQNDNDPGSYSGNQKVRKVFQYTFNITGNERITINNKVFTEPTISEDTNSRAALSWLRQNALLPKGNGWFAAGYGAFRRLTRANRIIVPSLQPPLRYTNFFTQFREDEALEAFETWLVFLDYKITKSKDKTATKQMELGIKAINKLLPKAEFHSIDKNGKIWFKVNGAKVATVSLPDGFRSILALAGDLVWRLIEAFPNSKNALEEYGVVLIDELDIHLHPTWQRTISGLLREIFPNIQFIMATHSPLVALGAGVDAVTYRLYSKSDKINIDQLKNVHSYNVDKILQSEAFGLVSTYSPETQEKIDKYYRLKKKKKLTLSEEKQLKLIFPLIQEVNKELPNENSLDYKIEQFLAKKLK